MMSSCRNGRVISSTACLSGWNPMISRAPSTASSPKTSVRRRRRTFARRAATAGRRRDAALAVPILAQLLKQFRQLDLQLLNRPVVAHHEVRSLGLFVLRQLPCGPGLHQLVTAGGRALGSQVLVGDDDNRLVEHLFHSRLEQQRHLHHCRGAIIRVLAELRNPLADTWPEHALEPLALLVVAEDTRRNGAAVD